MTVPRPTGKVNSWWRSQENEGDELRLRTKASSRERLEVDLDRRQIALNVRESYWKAKAMQTLAALYDENARYFRQVMPHSTGSA